MNKYKQIIIFSVFFFSFIICDSKEKNIISLADSTIEKAIKENKYIMILFFVPWCNHCHTFEPEFEKACLQLKNDNITFAKIDSSDNKISKEKYKVDGFPTTLFFINGDPIEFDGGRSQYDIINWVKKKIGLALQIIKSKEDIEKYKQENEVCLIYFGDNERDIDILNKTSKFIEEFPFAIVKSEILIKQLGEENTLILYKHFDEKENRLKKISFKNIKEFIDKYAYPKVMIFNDKSVQYIFKKKNPALILYSDKKSKYWNKYGNMMLEISKKINRKLFVVMSDIKEGISARLADYIGIKENEIPLVSIIDARDGLKKYFMEGKINLENILNFVKNWDEDKLKRQLKSENPPKINNGDIFIVVGKTFQKEVIENKKDVMILFYAPWCSHCKELIPKYEEVGKRLKENNPNLLVAKIDGAENEVENISVTGFPTILFFPGNKKNIKPKEYKGRRETKDIIEFIIDNSDNKIIYDIENKEDIRTNEL